AIFTKRTTPGLAAAGTMLACAAIGFVDDYLKLTNRRSLGLSGRWKMLGLAAVVAGLGAVAHNQHLSTDVYLPVLDTYVGLGPAASGWAGRWPRWRSSPRRRSCSS